MAPRLDISDNVTFLFHCIESTGVKIDFHKVGSALGNNHNAARMRYSRLRKAIENGSPLSPGSATLPLTPATPSGRTQPGTTVGAEKKRKRKAEVVEVGDVDEDIDDEEVEATVEKVVGPISDLTKPSERRKTRGKKIDYSEHLSNQMDLPQDSDDDYHSDSESEPVTPRNKRKRSRVMLPTPAAKNGIASPPPTQKSIKQVCASPDPAPKRQTANTFKFRTPPVSARKRKPIIDVGREEDDHMQNSPQGLMSLICGQRVSCSPVTFNSEDADKTTRSSLESPIGRSIAGLNLGKRDSMDGGLGISAKHSSLAPADSISSFGDTRPRDLDTTDTIGNGLSFLQKLAAFWK